MTAVEWSRVGLRSSLHLRAQVLLTPGGVAKAGDELEASDRQVEP